MLEDMTLFAKGKIDKKYIEDGGWQARAGGKILKQGENRVSEEITATSIVFRIKNARQNWNSVLPIGVFLLMMTESELPLKRNMVILK